MAQAQPRRRGLSDEERKALKADVRREIMDEIADAESFEDLRDKLEEQSGSGLTMAEIRGMTTEQVLENKAAVDEVMSRGPGADVFERERAEQQPSPPRGKTGQQALDQQGSPAALTRDMVRRMSADEINARWDEVQALMQRGAA
jgi:site-specific recombinase XerC